MPPAPNSRISRYGPTMSLASGAGGPSCSSGRSGSFGIVSRSWDVRSATPTADEVAQPRFQRVVLGAQRVNPAAAARWVTRSSARSSRLFSADQVSASMSNCDMRPLCQQRALGYFSASASQNRAFSQSRRTVRSVTSSASAISCLRQTRRSSASRPLGPSARRVVRARRWRRARAESVVPRPSPPGARTGRQRDVVRRAAAPTPTDAAARDRRSPIASRDRRNAENGCGLRRAADPPRASRR